MIVFLLTLLVLGVFWYVAETYFPMPSPMRLIVRVVFFVVVMLFVLRYFGLLA